MASGHRSFAPSQAQSETNRLPAGAPAASATAAPDLSGTNKDINDVRGASRSKSVEDAAASGWRSDNICFAALVFLHHGCCLLTQCVTGVGGDGRGIMAPDAREEEEIHMHYHDHMTGWGTVSSRATVFQHSSLFVRPKMKIYILWICSLRCCFLNCCFTFATPDWNIFPIVTLEFFW